MGAENGNLRGNNASFISQANFGPIDQKKYLARPPILTNSHANNITPISSLNIVPLAERMAIAVAIPRIVVKMTSIVTADVGNDIVLLNVTVSRVCEASRKDLAIGRLIIHGEVSRVEHAATDANFVARLGG